MKKLFSIVFLLLVTVVLSGCTVYNNEIYNRSVVVDIDVTNFGEPIVPIAQRASQAVFGVSNYQQNVRVGIGTGVIYKVEANLKTGLTVPYSAEIDEMNIKSYNYFAVTNRHVIKDYDKVKAYLGADIGEVDAIVLGSDSKVDIAVIKFEFTELYLPLEFGDSNLIKKGHFAIAIGNPSGYEFYGSTTFGIISHPQRYVPEDTNGDGRDDWDTEYIQHNVAINPGNSGGPLINMDGKIIGINTMKFVSEDIDNMGFSIPSNIVKDLIPYLELGKLPVRPFFGLSYTQIGGISGISLANRHKYNIPNDLNYGLIVHNIDQNSFLSNSSIKENDIILSVNGENIKYYYSFIDIVDDNQNKVFEIEILRDGIKHTIVTQVD